MISIIETDDGRFVITTENAETIMRKLSKEGVEFKDFKDYHVIEQTENNFVIITPQLDFDVSE